MLEKVRALLNKADPDRGATLPEQAAAMAKAQELMTKHHIDMMDATAAGAEESCFDIGREDWVCDRAGRRNADSYVAKVLRECFGVDIVFTWFVKPGAKKASLSYAIMGDAIDRSMAKLAAPIIYKTMLKGLSEWLRVNSRSWTAAIERSFCSGVQDGYITASDEGKAFAMKHLTKDQKEQFGLILVQKDALIETFKEKEFPRLRSTRTRPGHGSAEARSAGFGKGASMKLTPTRHIA